jgi:uncharacterized MAPEG superfamily protein
MTIDLQLVAFACALTWVMVFSTAFIRARAWTPAGMKVAFGNRDTPDATQPAWLDRSERAAKNMCENLPLFIGLVAVAHLGGRQGHRVELGAHLFFWARVAYWPIYLAGIPVVRTMIWWVSIAGLAVIFSALL